MFHEWFCFALYKEQGIISNWIPYLRYRHNPITIHMLLQASDRAYLNDQLYVQIHKSHSHFLPVQGIEAH